MFWRLSCAISLAIWAAAIPSASSSSEGAEMKARILEFAELENWSEDDHDDALEVFRATCDLIKGPEWPQLCALAEKQQNAKSFFELFFRPVMFEDGNAPLFTGYFEPELRGSRRRTATYRYPVYGLPNDVTPGSPYFTRREIAQGALTGRGLEIAWVDDPVELFFLQVQGSGRIKLTDGSVTRIGYAGHNGHNYQSIGKELIRRGVYEPHQVSAKVIQNWVRRNPIDGPELLFTNPSYVFFREQKKLGASDGPIGAMNRSIASLRSIAIDPKFVPLGAPVWIEKKGEDPMNRLMIAQDTGSAIKGAQRADIFYGSGARAGDRAGRIRDAGRLIVLLPIQLAYGALERAEG